MEDSLVRSLVKDIDSTGNAYLKHNGAEFRDSFDRPLPVVDNFFKHAGAVEYSYDDCLIDSFTDGRDGQKYDAVCIGDQIWMAENLNYNVANSVCYDQNAGNCDSYGRLYKWDAVMAGASASAANPSGVRGVCPSGWHLPSNAEWQKLSGSLGGQTVSGGAMKALNLWDAPNAGATNSSGFSGLPAGVFQNYLFQTPQFNSKGQTAFFWTSTALSTERSRVTQLIYDDGALTYAAVYISETYVSVRCVKD